LIGPFTKKKFETLEAPPKYKVLCDDVMFPFWSIYKGEQGRTLGNWMIQKAIEMPKDELQITFRLRHQLNLNYDIIAF
jgi:hypothetical protein